MGKVHCEHKQWFNRQTRLAHNKKNVFTSFYFDVVMKVSVSPLFKDMSLTDCQIFKAISFNFLKMTAAKNANLFRCVFFLKRMMEIIYIFNIMCWRNVFKHFLNLIRFSHTCAQEEGGERGKVRTIWSKTKMQKNTKKGDPLDFLTAPSSPLKRIWLKLQGPPPCISN